MADLIHLVSPAIDGRIGGGTDVVVDVSTGVPTIVHWGASLGDHPHLDRFADALDRPIARGTLDVVAPVSVVPEHGSGFTGRPGLQGRRGRGRAWSPRFRATGHRVQNSPSVSTTGAVPVSTLIVDAVDDVAGLGLQTVISLADVVRIRSTLTNESDSRYSLDALTSTLPLPQHADELLVFEGRWSREFHPVRTPWPRGAIGAENRRGRTSHEHSPLIFAGTRAFTEWDGEVWGVHVAWSGNHTLLADRLPDGRRYIQGGELLHPGEIVLEAGESYRTPEVLAVYSGEGLTAATQQFHRALRSRPTHPVAPRPVLINTWEAVYFDHDAARLNELADVAASVGIERFVLDDGWFGTRRNDAKGLGEWWVSSDVYPNGLAPLITHVTGLGLDFGIWVEPEMVNPDSEVLRAHPDWAFTTDGYEPVLGRNQLLLDLSNADAYAFVLEHLDSLLTDHEISFVKWDMNRDHVQGSTADGAAGTHRVTLAMYALLDELRRRHPGVEFESCASGGGRVDHEILMRTDRVWTSDCNDALERQLIQRGVSMLIPAELMGAHIGPTRSHTTGRSHSIAFRGATAMFGHLGVEWDITKLDARQLDDLRRVIEIHKEHRQLFHTGDAVRFDTEPYWSAHGVYSSDRTAGIVSFAQLTTAPSLTPPPLRLPGLEPERSYLVEHLELPGELWRSERAQPAWLTDGVVLTGAQLAAHGVQPPTLYPESAIVFTLTAQ